MCKLHIVSSVCPGIGLWLMSESNQFLYQVHFRALPHSTFKLHYNLVPLLAGNLRLPTVHLNMLRYPNTMNAIVQKMLPTHAFIRVSRAKLKINGRYMNSDSFYLQPP